MPAVPRALWRFDRGVDFGYSWDHVIKLEKWFDNTTTEGLPLFLEAAGRCPPEDVGGAPGYAEYLDAIGDPAYPEYEQMRLWARSGSIPTSSTERRSRLPSTRYPEFGSHAGKSCDQNSRQEPIKRAVELRLRMINSFMCWSFSPTIDSTR